jgi:hypothetical protein
MDNWSDFDFVCQKVLEAMRQGDPYKDVLEQTPYSEADFVYELVLQYLRYLT